MSNQSKVIKVNAAYLENGIAKYANIECFADDEGLPGIAILGLSDNQNHNARCRIRAALKSSGFEVPRRRLIVNVICNNDPLYGTSFDLPIAVALLAVTGQISSENLDELMFSGELGLDGGLQFHTNDSISLLHKLAHSSNKELAVSKPVFDNADLPFSYVGLSSLKELAYLDSLFTKVQTQKTLLNVNLSISRSDIDEYVEKLMDSYSCSEEDAVYAVTSWLDNFFSLEHADLLFKSEMCEEFLPEECYVPTSKDSCLTEQLEDLDASAPQPSKIFERHK